MMAARTKNIVLAVEDRAHESVVLSLINRIVIECGQQPSDWTATTLPGGRGSKSLNAARDYARSCKTRVGQAAGLFVVASDSNCVGFVEKKRQIEHLIADYPAQTAFALPNSHVERWLLLDPHAFKEGVGLSRGVSAPTFKCEQDHYKKLIVQALREEGIVPQFLGLEFAGEIIRRMDLNLARKETDFDEFYSSVRAVIQNA